MLVPFYFYLCTWRSRGNSFKITCDIFRRCDRPKCTLLPEQFKFGDVNGVVAVGGQRRPRVHFEPTSHPAKRSHLFDCTAGIDRICFRPGPDPCHLFDNPGQNRISPSSPTHSTPGLDQARRQKDGKVHIGRHRRTGTRPDEFLRFAPGFLQFLEISIDIDVGNERCSTGNSIDGLVSP